MATIDVSQTDTPKSISPAAWDLRDENGQLIDSNWLADQIKVLNGRATKLKNRNRTMHNIENVSTQKLIIR